MCTVGSTAQPTEMICHVFLSDYQLCWFVFVRLYVHCSCLHQKMSYLYEHPSEIDRLFDEELQFSDDDNGEECSETEDNFIELEEQFENEVVEPELPTENQPVSLQGNIQGRPRPHVIGNVYVCKGNNNPRQYVSYPQRVTRRRTQNIIRERPGIKRQGIVTSAKESFEKFFTPEIINIIVTHTNEEARRKNIPLTDGTELMAYLGLIILMGSNKDSKVDYHELWSTLYGRPVYNAVMSRTRFIQITNILRFDDKNTREARRTTDKFAPMRNIFELVNNLFPQYLSAGENTTIDEMLSLFRGRCPFKVFMKDKPGKYGILIRMLCDANSRYVLNMEVYCGRTDIERGTIPLVCRLVMPIAQSGRNVTTDRYYTSVDLAEKLYNEYKLTLVGTMQLNRKHIPTELKDVRERPVYSSMFAFTDSRTNQAPVTLVSYKVKDKPVRNLIMLSTQHEDDSVSDDDKHKPDIVTFYNSSKGGVDSVDQMARNYTVKRGTKRWPMTVFYTLLDIVCINAYTLYIENFSNWKLGNNNRRLQFLRMLALELIKPQINVRAQDITGLNKTTLCAIEEVLGKKLHYNVQIQATPQVEVGRRRCHICVSEARSKKTKYDKLGKSKVICNNCEKHVCGKHSKNTVTCEKCHSEHTDNE